MLYIYLIPTFKPVVIFSLLIFAGRIRCNIVLKLFQVLLSGATVSLTYGRRYGLVGRNGLGKSTLLRTLSRRQLIIPKHISILHVEQEVVGDDTIALQSVLESFTRREELLKEEKTINAALAEG